MTVRAPHFLLRKDHDQKGAVTVEFMLLAPALAIFVLGAVYFGGVLTSRHRITEAVNFAVRAAIATPNPAGSVDALFTTRLAATGGNGRCTAISLTKSTSALSAGQEALEATATCTLAAPIGSSLLGITGGGTVRATAAMPYRVPVP